MRGTVLGLGEGVSGEGNINQTETTWLIGDWKWLQWLVHPVRSWNGGEMRLVWDKLVLGKTLTIMLTTSCGRYWGINEGFYEWVSRLRESIWKVHDAFAGRTIWSGAICKAWRSMEGNKLTRWELIVALGTWISQYHRKTGKLFCP